MVFAFIAVLVSCKKKDDTPTDDTVQYGAPTVTFTDNVTTAKFMNSSKKVTITGTTKADNGLKSVKFSVLYHGGEKNLGDSVTTFTTSTSYDFSTIVDSASFAKAGIMLDSTDIAAGITVKVTAVDTKSLSTVGSFVVTFEANSILEGDAIETYTATLLGAQSNLSKGSYYASSTNTVYLQNDAKNNSSLIDMIYFYGTDNKATLAAPNDVTVGGTPGNLTLATILPTKNATTFKTTSISTSAFDAIKNDAALTALTGITETKAPQLLVDHVIAFKTEAGKIGLIKVTNLVTGEAGSMTITVKVQK